jgi:hypothetical protein
VCDFLVFDAVSLAHSIVDPLPSALDLNAADLGALVSLARSQGWKCDRLEGRLAMMLPGAVIAPDRIVILV